MAKCVLVILALEGLLQEGEGRGKGGAGTGGGGNSWRGGEHRRGGGGRLCGVKGIKCCTVL